MNSYIIQTDAFLTDEILAETLDAAISIAFAEDGVKSAEELESYIAGLDGAWVWIDENGERTFSVGSHRG